MLSSVHIAYLLVVSIFSKELLGISVGGSVVDVFLLGLTGYSFVFASLSDFAVRIGAIWLLLLTISLTISTILGYPIDIIAKQGLVAAVVYVGIANLLSRTDSNSLLLAYWNVCVIAAAFGIVQFIASIGGLSILMKQAGRLDSFTYEPSHYAIAIGPAAYLAMREVLQARNFKNWQALVILVSMLLTVSLTAAIILFISACLLTLQKQGVVLAFGVIFVMFYLYMHQELLPDLIRERLDASLALEANTDEADILNLSVLSPVSNWNVAVASLDKGRYLGNGIGGHFYAYYEHFAGAAFAQRDRFGTNAIGAHSLFIRAFSEMGVLGLLAYLAWVAKGIRCVSDPNAIWWTLSAVYLIGRAIKLGGFFEIGLPVFLLAPWCFSSLQQYGRDLQR